MSCLTEPAPQAQNLFQTAHVYVRGWTSNIVLWSNFRTLHLCEDVRFSTVITRKDRRRLNNISPTPVLSVLWAMRECRKVHSEYDAIWIGGCCHRTLYPGNKHDRVDVSRVLYWNARAIGLSSWCRSAECANLLSIGRAEWACLGTERSNLNRDSSGK